jgi:AcrR family transcriptional regulator
MARLAQKVKDKAVGRSRTKVVRRTNAERSEATRERVIAAAIHVLHTRGYSGATTLAIQEAAAMSLGALQHQFPTKAKLMAAVAERFCEHRFKRYDEAARAGTDPLDCVKRMLDVTGAILRDGEFVSGLEISLAKRNDPELEVELRPLKRYDDQMKELLDKIARDANLSEEFWNKNAVVLSNAVARGLAVEMLGGGDRASVVGAFAMWRQMVLDIFAREMKPRRRGA